MSGSTFTSMMLNRFERHSIFYLLQTVLDESTCVGVVDKWRDLEVTRFSAFVQGEQKSEKKFRVLLDKFVKELKDEILFNRSGDNGSRSSEL